MKLNKDKFKKLYRLKSKIAFATVFLTGFLFDTAAWAKDKESIVDTGCAGFLCGVHNALKADPVFSAGEALFTAFFLAVNAGIIIVLSGIVVKIANSEQQGEEFKSLGTKVLYVLVAMFFVNGLAAWAMKPFLTT